MAKAKKSIKGTKTEANLVKAYISESAAYTRYTYYAKQADKEEYYPIGQVFRETAENEIHHGKVFFKLLEGGKVNVTIDPDAGVIGNTAENLATAAAEEEAEGIEQYIAAAKVADEEGFTDIAKKFRAVAAIERHHEERYRRLLANIEEGIVFSREGDTVWICRNCGHIVIGKKAPELCPVCLHTKSFFEIEAKNY